MSATTPLFSLEHDYGTVVAELATDLFYEAVGFAVMASTIRAGGKSLDLYLPRMEMIRLTLGAFTDALGMRFRERVPFIYNGATWTCPRPSGYTDGSNPQCPRPDEVIRSLMSACESLRYQESSGQRLEKAVTYVAATEGYAAALSYLLDLIDFGYAGGYGGGTLALIDLVAFHSCHTPSPDRENEACRQWAASRLPDLALERSGQDWTAVSLRHAGASASLKGLHDDRIFSRVFERIARARAASNLSEFLFNIARLKCLVEVVMAARGQLYDPKTMRIPIALRSIYSQLEEIRADGSIFLRMVCDKRLSPTGATVFGVSRNFAYHTSPEVGRRILRQRVLTPDVLGELPIDGYPNLPPEWQRLDYRHIIPMGALAGALPADLPFKGHATPLGAVVTESARHYYSGLWEAQFSGIATPYERIEEAEALSFSFPWSADFHVRLAILTDQDNRPHHALAPISAAAFQLPRDADIWQSFAVIVNRCGGDADLVRRLQAIGRYLAQFDPVSH